jgi:hypothetical protein
MKYALLICFLLLTSVVFSQTNTKINDSKDDVRPHDLGISENTSLIRLIASPEKYDGKSIQVIGYLHLKFEGDALYLHKEDYENGLHENAFWVSFSKKIAERDLTKYNDKYAIIIGTFRLNDKGHMGLFAGTIDNIVRLDTWRERKKEK